MSQLCSVDVGQKILVLRGGAYVPATIIKIVGKVYSVQAYDSSVFPVGITSMIVHEDSIRGMYDAVVVERGRSKYPKLKEVYRDFFTDFN